MTLFARRVSRHLVDLSILALAFWAAFLLRFDGEIPYEMFKRFVLLVPYVAGAKLLVLVAFGVPRYAWRHVGATEAMRIFAALGTVTLALIAMRLVGTALHPRITWIHFAQAPFGVIAMDFALSFLGVTGVRVGWRVLHERRGRQRAQRVHPGPKATTLLVGAGGAGAQLARELINRPDLGLEVVGFLDDDPNKLHEVVHGIRVLGTVEDMERLVRAHAVQQVVITIASAGGPTIRRIVATCEKTGIRPQIVPSIRQVLEGRVVLGELREVRIEDLLGREPVALEGELIRGMASGRCVAVTGAGGSIGSELCRQVAHLDPSRLVLVERSEPALFSIYMEMLKAHPALDIIPAVVDVGDAERVDALLAEHAPAVIFHAAAHKHVPLMEANIPEAIKNNVFGTRVIADAADRHGVASFVLISTDKAVNPTSVMGATKRCAEVYLQALARRSKTRFVAVRFGNVLGSAGSVIPIFQAQIRAGGPVTVTHEDMVRYFMTIPEASQLVLQAGAMGQGGEIFVLDMGEPMRIVDLARDLIRLSGLEPDVDIPISFSGVRPGEKLFEELGFDAEHMDRTRHPSIYVGKLGPVAWEQVLAGLAELERCSRRCLRDEGLAALRMLVPEMQEDARVPGAR